MTTIQLALFGDVAQSPVRAAAAEESAARAARWAEFERRARHWPDGTEVTWIPSENQTGDPGPGWRCWLCGEVEPSDWVLTNSHRVGWMHSGDLDRQQCYPMTRVPWDELVTQRLSEIDPARRGVPA